MRTITFFTTILLLLSGFTYAQQTYVPDDNFENYLETHNSTGALVSVGDPNSMGNGIANDDYVLTSRISSVTALNIMGQNIANLTGIEDFTNLQNFICWGNQLTSLNMSQNTSLQRLECWQNQLTSIDISQNTALQELWCSNNQLTNLDITHNTALQQLYCSTNLLTDLDVAQNTALQILDCHSNQLTVLDIQQNTALTYLDCSINRLTNLDVSQNTDLRELYCNRNRLTSLDVLQNTVLRRLYCHNNPQLASLDISHNPDLISLYCYNNQLSSLDLSQNSILQVLKCFNNQLSSFDIRNGNNTNFTEFNATGNPDLTCVFVDNASYMNTNWANAIDATATYVENQAQCDALQTTYVPDDNFENYLETHDATGYPVAVGDANSMGNGIANDDYVITSKISNVTNLVISGRDIANLTGIEDFVALENLDCSYNQLTSIDISYNTNLQTLNCYNNQLASLNVSQNTALQALDCDNNQLTNLDVSHNTNLQTLNCYNNQLASLNVSQNTALQTLECYNNQLTNLDISHNTNLQTLNCYNNQLVSLNVSQNIALQTLECYNNQLTNLDISNNTLLQTLYCSYNQLTGLNITQNINLQELGCSNNQLTNLNTTQNVNLQKLYCHNNQLTDLDVSQNTGLVRLNCSNNRLTGLNLQNGNNTNLIYFNATVNPDLTCVFVDDTNYMNTHWHGTIDATAFYVETQAECDTLTHTTYVPDDNFENYLETHDANGQPVAIGNTNSMGNGIANDDTILTHRISNIVHINVSQNNISDLTGIADFTDLQQLNCASNQLTSLDVSHNLALQTLNCSNNQLTSLNVSQNTALQTLDCYENQLTSLNVSQNTVLESLACGFNQITELDVSQNTSLTSLSCHYNQLTGLNLQNGNNTNFTYFAANNNPDLSCIFVDDANYMNTHWANAIDIMETYVENQTQCNAAMQTTYVPDDNFENYLETHGANGGIVPLGNINSMGNGIANDNYVLTSRINDITNLDISSQNISDLTGIAAFTTLQEFVCSDNQLTGINVSQNTALERLYCSDNQLTNINLLQNTNLEALYCSNNQITSLDVSQNTGLTELECFSNQLTSLDLRNGNHANLTDFDANGNTNLTCIFVDDANYMNTNWGGAIDATATYVETQAECDALSPQTTSVPDDNFENYLETHDADGNIVPVGDINSMGNGIANDDAVFTSNISNVTDLNVSGLNITDLTGIEHFTALHNLSCQNNQITGLSLSQNTTLGVLDCSNNRLTNIDVSQNTSLSEFYCANNQLTNLVVPQSTVLHSFDCSNNQLTGLNLSHNTGLISLYCSNNQLTNLDVSVNAGLTGLECFSNQLTSLDLRNGNHTNLTDFDANGNPNLTCIFVDDANYMNTNWGGAIDATATYVETQAECDALTQTTYIPDGYFEIYLETHDVNGNVVPLGNPNSLGNGTYDNYVPTSKISNVTNLDIHFQNISDLTGIEDFTALQVLYCYSNTIATLDLSQNTALQELNCSLSLLTSLDLSHNPALQTLLCYNTHLTSLNVTQNASLQELDCRENQLTSLDVTHNPALQKLYCNNNQLSSLDVTQNPALQDLQCYSNQLTNLDITQNPVLQILYCDYNQITDINTTQNPSLLWFNCHANQLTSLDVSQNPDLQELICNGNQLTNLDMRNGHNTNLITFYALGNNLTCVFVDDKNYMNTNWASAIDATATYVETQAECDALGIDETFKESIHIYPNPINEYLSIQVPDKENIKSISIQNMQGQVVYQSDFAPQIKLADLPADMYFLRIENKTGDVAVFKLIKD